MRYEIGPDPNYGSEWRVEGFDEKTGDIYVTVFGSADAERRAREYKAWVECHQLENAA